MSSGPSESPSLPPPAHEELAESQLTEISSLLRTLEDLAASQRSGSPATDSENRLVQVRLGIASSLFVALRCKHAATAGHSLRVALTCSAWSSACELEPTVRDAIEVAALLHDVGKIGVPDHILQKPGPLNQDERAIVDRQSALGLQILGCCCQANDVMEIVKYAGAWFDGTRDGYDKCGLDLPLGARMLAIADAYDAMTTDHVYRRALSKERAATILVEGSSTQFDASLVEEFCSLHGEHRLDIHGEISQQWLGTLVAEQEQDRWQMRVPTAERGQIMPVALFQQSLLHGMQDAVVFVDSQLQIFLWNQAAERLTGILGSAAQQRPWVPSLTGMRDSQGIPIREEDCLVAEAIKTGQQSVRRVSIYGRQQQEVPVEAHVVPVRGHDGTTYGATVLLQDVAQKSSLEKTCLSLHAKATRDPLTQVANRAEFDRVHPRFLVAHRESKLPCSLIIADIDHFKGVNDTYGHQAGDEVIVRFAKQMQAKTRTGDLVARYGGEEFVVLCADCDIAQVTRRAEEIRRAFAETPHAMLGGRCCTASFGVTELQPGDTADTMLHRADRALYEAKDSGRNKVVQLGSGSDDSEETEPSGGGWWPFASRRNNALFSTRLVAQVPLGMAIEKLRGFVADHTAQIVTADDRHIELLLDTSALPMLRRTNDRAVPFTVELDFPEEKPSSSAKKRGQAAVATRTIIDVTIRPKRTRDRRRHEATERAREVLNSLRSYLMAREM